MSEQPDPARVAFALRLLEVTERGGLVFRGVAPGEWWMRAGENGCLYDNIVDALIAAEEVLGVDGEDKEEIR